MDYVKWLQVAGLSFAFVGAILLSIDTLGKQRVYDFLSRWFEILRRHRFYISLSIGLAVVCMAIYFKDIWSRPLIEVILPPMFNVSVISIWLFTIVTMAIVQLFYGGRASYRHTGITIIMTVTTFYRLITNPGRWKPLIEQLQKQIISSFHLFLNTCRFVVETVPRAERRSSYALTVLGFDVLLLILLLGLAIAYLVTEHPKVWASSIAVNLGLIIYFSLITVGFLFNRAILGGL